MIRLRQVRYAAALSIGRSFFKRVDDVYDVDDVALWLESELESTACFHLADLDGKKMVTHEISISFTTGVVSRRGNKTHSPTGRSQGDEI